MFYNGKDGFIFGAQYYRAPTPSRGNWENDLKNMKAMGLNSVKFWVQWRWTHRGTNDFYYEDIDCLMDLAAKNGLKVTLNIIFDVAPGWVFDQYPDCRIVLADGTVMEPRAEGHRQIGGFPGTCYNHDEAFRQRMRFLRKTTQRYKDHPAMYMWDVWNEPEQCGPYRYAKTDKLPCFCSSCRTKFKQWLKKKYDENVDLLNSVWGRCYKDFEEIDLPVERFTFSDFLDYREFQLDTMTKEANARIRLVKEIDRKHPVYLHVVPNTSGIFNALTGVDDFEMAKECDVFASTNFAKPIWSILTLSAGRDKTCYNVECHIGSGSTKMHQKQITLRDMVKDLIPQIGMGIRGFMFWQYRPEVLGLESPAWGMTKPDGSIGSVGIAAKEFIERLSPYIEDIMAAKPPKTEIAVWKGRKNEILSFCIDNELTGFAKSVEAYVNAAYYSNYNCCVVNDERVIEGLDEIKLLIMPYCYEADEKLIRAVDHFVKNGGTLLCEAHLGGYNADMGRHSYTMPGCGADQLWDIHETYTTSSYHLESLMQREGLDTSGMADDVKKAIDAYGINGGRNFQILTQMGYSLTGANRFACIEAQGARVIGRFHREPCIISKTYGKGIIIYCGTNLGEDSQLNETAFRKFVVSAAEAAGVCRNPYSTRDGIHIDHITDHIIAVNNSTKEAVEIALEGTYTSLFQATDLKTDFPSERYMIEAESADLLIRQD